MQHAVQERRVWRQLAQLATCAGPAVPHLRLLPTQPPAAKALSPWRADNLSQFSTPYSVASQVLPSILLSVWQAIVLPQWFYNCAQVGPAPRVPAVVRAALVWDLWWCWSHSHL